MYAICKNDAILERGMNATDLNIFKDILQPISFEYQGKEDCTLNDSHIWAQISTISTICYPSLDSSHVSLFEFMLWNTENFF